MVVLREGDLVIESVDGARQSAGCEQLDDGSNVSVDVRRRVGVADASLGRKVHHVGEGDDCQEFSKESENRQRHGATPLLEGEEDVGAEEAGVTSDNHEHVGCSAAGEVGAGHDLLLPPYPAPGGGRELLGAGVDEALQTEVGGGEGDEKERPMWRWRCDCLTTMVVGCRRRKKQGAVLLYRLGR